MTQLEDDAYEADCTTCGGTGYIDEPACTTGPSQHSACRYRCDECDGKGTVPAKPLKPAPGAPEGWREDLDRTLARAESLIDALMDNEPFDTAADGGVTVLMVWRHDAQSLRTEILKQRAALTSSSATGGE